MLLAISGNIFGGEKVNFHCLDIGKPEIKVLCQQHSLNYTWDITNSMKDLETEIVDLEKKFVSTGNQEHFEP